MDESENKNGSDDTTARSAEGMTDFIRKAAAEIVKESLEPIMVPKAAGSLSAEEMLAVVSCAYEKDVYEPERIEELILHDPGMQAKLGKTSLDPEAIRKFRKFNAFAIAHTLEKAYRFKRRKEKEAMHVAPPGQPVPETSNPLIARDGEETVFLTRSQADRRVKKAITNDVAPKKP